MVSCRFGLGVAILMMTAGCAPSAGPTADGSGGSGSSAESTPDACADGLDNDGDGKIDCADPDCRVAFFDTICQGTPGSGGAGGTSATGGNGGDCGETGCHTGCEVEDCTPQGGGGGDVGGLPCEGNLPVPRLPFPTGQHMGVSQGPGCKGHVGTLSAAYDFNVDGSSYESDHGMLAVASTSGTVTEVVSTVQGSCYMKTCGAAYNKGWGNCVVVQIDNSCIYERYCHLKPGGVLVTKGDHVCAGQPLGYIGTTGNSSGDHLHWQRERSNGQSIPVASFQEVVINGGCTPCGTGSHLSGCYQSANAPQASCPTPVLDACSGKANGDYCGSNPALAGYPGSPNDLVSCQGGQIAAVKPCAGGCDVKPAGQDDVCHMGTSTQFCGNGTKEAAEQCDGAQLGGATCQSMGFDHGNLGCAPGTCTYDTAGCCKNQCAQQGATQCVGNLSKTCQPDAQGCLALSGGASCMSGCDAATGKCNGPCTGINCNMPPNAQCYEAVGTCNAGGMCNYAPKPYGTPCNDSNACTTGDVCDGNGTCGGSPMQCSAPPNTQCFNAAGSCSGGNCNYTPKPYGTPCNDGNAGTNNDQCDAAGTCSGTTCPPSVFNVTPLNVTLNQTTTFVASGNCLPSTVTPFIPECANLTVTSVTPTQLTFQCTPSYTPGVKSSVIKDKPNGSTLLAFNVTVGCTASVSSVTPTTATLNQLKTFTITGNCLPSTIAPFIPECANLSVTSVTATQATFQCTPSYTKGVKNGVVKDKPGGVQLKDFTVTVN